MTVPNPTPDEQKVEDLLVRSFRRALKEEREAEIAEASARTKTGEQNTDKPEDKPADKPESLVGKFLGGLFG